MDLIQLDKKIIHLFHVAYIPFARLAIFVVYFWFGLLKIYGVSPASSMVRELFAQTLSFLPFDAFYLFFSGLEIVIGILFLFPRLTRVVIPLLFLHMLATALPLLLLPHLVWQHFLVPTLEGQYIIKNLVIVATAIGIAGHVHVMRHHHIRH